MEEDIDFWKYNYKYFIDIISPDLKDGFIVYDCVIEPPTSKGVLSFHIWECDYTAFVRNYSEKVDFNVDIEVAKSYFPEFNKTVHEITKEEFLEIIHKIGKFRMDETQVKCNKMRLILKYKK